MGEDTHSYVFKTPDGDWRVQGSRVSIASIVHLYWEGRSPEEIALEFPSLTFEQIHGVLAFYLRHRNEIDEHIASLDKKWERMKDASEQRNQPLLERIRTARQNASAHRTD